MDKEMGQIKFTETDDGLRIDIKGKNLKEAIDCGCVPMFGGAKAIKVECCSDDDKKMEDCCPPGDNKKNK